MLVFCTKPVSCIAALPQHQFYLQFQIFLPVSRCQAVFELKIWKGFLALLPALLSRKDEHLEILLTITINILGKTNEDIERYLDSLMKHFISFHFHMKFKAFNHYRVFHLNAQLQLKILNRILKDLKKNINLQPYLGSCV